MGRHSSSHSVYTNQRPVCSSVFPTERVQGSGNQLVKAKVVPLINPKDSLEGIVPSNSQSCVFKGPGLQRVVFLTGDMA